MTIARQIPDIGLHGLAGFALGLPGYYAGAPVWVICYLLFALGLLRELAQEYKSNVFIALWRSPSWGWGGWGEAFAWPGGFWLGVFIIEQVHP